jgi:hypothetical protein
MLVRWYLARRLAERAGGVEVTGDLLLVTCDLWGVKARCVVGMVIEVRLTTHKIK